MIDRFLAHVEIGEGCWPWRGALNKKRRIGYFNTQQPGRTNLAHRLSWEFANKQRVPEGMLVCHHCDNPQCVRPSHLFLGTQSDNMYDMHSKKRHRYSEPAVSTHCRRGHELTSDNVAFYAYGKRKKPNMRCRQCDRDRANSRWQRLKVSHA